MSDLKLINKYAHKFEIGIEEVAEIITAVREHDAAQWSPETNLLPFGLLTKEQQDILRNWPHGTKIFLGREWADIDSPSWVGDCAYRAKPAPAVIPASVDQAVWDVIPENYITWDANKDVWGYEEKPSFSVTRWSGYGARRLTGFRGLHRGTCDWREAIVARPGLEGVRCDGDA